MNSPNPTQSLVDAGVSIWLDDLSRSKLEDGSLSDLIRDANVTGVTTNPSIFHAAITRGAAYDDALATLKDSAAGAEEALFELMIADVSDACSQFTAIFQATGGVDGRVSIEVDPRLARDSDATIQQALRLYDAVGRPNVLIKIPATVEGLDAITHTIAAGISVNVTLIFSIDRYRAVIGAYKAGLEQALASGHDISTIHSVASFFVSRLDVEIDRRLDLLDAPSLKGRAAIANAALAYELYRETFSREEWVSLANAGAHPQRPLWASTGVKGPDYPDTMYVTKLVAPGTINTMPRATIDALQDHGIIAPNRLRKELAGAKDVFTSLHEVGVSYDDVVHRLEEEGLARFVESWDLAIADVAARLT